MANGTNVNFFGTPFPDDLSNPVIFTGILAGNDVLEGDAGNDILNGFNGIDQIKGEEGNDQLFGGAGNDSLFGGIDHDTISGGANDDHAEGGFGNDEINGNDGNDTLWGDNASTLPLANPVNNLIAGLADPVLDGDDTINGGTGSDFIFGEDGNDSLSGNEDNDVIDGGLGSDILIGGLGSDTLTGGAGFDIFKFSPIDSLIDTTGDIDIITDFDVNQDRISFVDFALGGVVGEVGGLLGGTAQFAFDDFSNGMTQGLDSAFYQEGNNVIIDAREVLGYGLGSLGTDAPGQQSQIIIENVNIDDLGGFNFIFTPELETPIG